MKDCWGIRLLGVFLLFSFGAFAQSPTGSISGVVEDQSGAAIPGAKLTITDADTGITRSVDSDAEGRYSVPSLIPDHYEIQAESTGFATEVRRGIQLTVGSQLEINMALRVGQTTEQVEVTTEAPLVETQTATISGLVNDQEIRDLPLNGRSVDQLISLESSAPTFHEKNASAQSGVGVTYSAHGARDQANLFLLDGMEMIGAYNYGTQPGGALGLNTGVDAIREFQVMTSNYSAVYGKHNGAIINMASKTGTNQFHGSAYEFLRNSALDARNFFDHQIPPFQRNQFGGSVGGPIVKKDRAFFFFNYEDLRENLGVSTVEVVPDLNARQGLVPNSSGQLMNVGVNPAVAPYLSFFPLPNGPDFGNGTAEAIFSPSQISTQAYYLGRVDYKISAKDSLFVRYTASPSLTYTVSPIIYQSNYAKTNLQMYTLQETRIFSPTIVNTFRAGVSRPTLVADFPSTVPLNPALDFLPGVTSPGQITITGTSTGAGALTLGSITNTPKGNTNPLPVAVTESTFGDDLLYQHGPHSFDFGVELQADSQINMDILTNEFGIFQFATLTSFLQGAPKTFTGPNPASLNDPFKSFRQTYTAAYVQDDYKVRRNLTLNLGMRWEFMTPPTEVYGRISNYQVHVVNGLGIFNTQPTLGSPFYESHYNDFAPRLGFAWDIMGDGKTAVRGGFGMFYDQLDADFRNIGYQNSPYLGTLQVSNPSFPLGFAVVPGASPLPNPTGFATNADVPTSIRYDLNIQRQITQNIAFMIGYVGSEAYHLTRKGDLNEVVPQILPGNIYFFPTNGPRANPALSSSTYLSTDATASYQGMDLQVSQRLSHGLRYKVSFTWSKEIDTATATVGGLSLGEATTTMEESQLGWDRGLGAFDLGRNLVGNFTYDLPWQKSKNTAVRWIGGWQASAIVTLQDGFPFTALTGFSRSGNGASSPADRPNLNSGVNGVPILGGPNEYYDPTVFSLPPVGEYGNLGRNTIIGPGLVETDANLVKIISVGERFKVDFRAEFFNLFNRANFGLPGNTIFTSSGAPNPTAGVITSTNTTSRQLQFGLKLLF